MVRGEVPLARVIGGNPRPAERGQSASRLGLAIGLAVAAALVLVAPAYWLLTRATMPGEAPSAGEADLVVASTGSPGGFSRRESVRVMIAIDEEWRSTLGAEAVEWSRVLLSLVSGELRGVGIHLLAVEVADWSSTDGDLAVGDLFDQLVRSVPGDGVDIVLGLTAQPLSDTADGHALIGGNHVIVAHHPGHPERDVMVATHEIAHLFGAEHGCDAEFRVGLMARWGFDEPEILCPATRDVLTLNAGRFTGADQ